MWGRTLVLMFVQEVFLTTESSQHHSLRCTVVTLHSGLEPWHILLVAHARLPGAQHLCPSCGHPVPSFLSYPRFSVCFSPLPPSPFQRRQIPSESGLINWGICCSLLSGSCDHLFDFCFLGTSTGLAPAEKGNKGGRDGGRQKGRKFLRQPHSWTALGPTVKSVFPE